MRYWSLRALYGVLFSLSVLLLTPRTGYRFNLKKGDIAPRDIIAPCDFYVKKPQEQYALEKERAYMLVPPVLVYTGIDEEIMEYLKKFPEKERKKIISVLSKGVLETKDEIPPFYGRKVVVKRDSREYMVDKDSILTLSEAKRRLSEIKDPKIDTLFYMLTPNLRVDLVETERRRKEAGDKVSPYKGRVLKGEMIIRAHDVVTEEVEEKLRSLEEARRGKREIKVYAGKFLYLIFLVSFLYFYLYFKKKEILDSLRHILLIFFVSLIILFIARITTLLDNPFAFYILPLGFAGLTLTLLSDFELGIIGSLFLSMSLLLFTGLRSYIPFILTLTGIGGGIEVRKLRHRAEFYYSGIVIFFILLISMVSVELVRGMRVLEILKASGFCVLNTLGSVLLTLGFLPVFERLFHLTTNLTYLELSDLNRPILRRLAMEAPGTFNHSLIVGALAEAACEAIGANSLLARVGGYYHDIGKIKRPEFFIENSTGRNPHDRLSPRTSAIILKSHVKDGVELARKERLPEEIIRIIREHHGTTLIRAFYEKEKRENGEVDEKEFRYPGPVPSSRESAVVMLADSVEAAARSLEEPAPEKIKALIEKIVDEKVKDHQMDNSGLSLKDIEKIKEVFYPFLCGSRHERIDYEGLGE